ncbi:MAG: glycoside hydrolase family 28 protein [Anaerocolumna sp.]
MAIYNVKDFGAVGDEKSLDTKAIQSTIDYCYENGGGSVLLENGTFISGTLYFRSNVSLTITAGAVLYASGNIGDYGDDTHYNRYVNEKDMDRCFIYGENCENISISGEGIINGNAEAFPNDGSIYRPMMIRVLNCKNVRLSGLRLYNSAAWTTAFLDSSGIWCDGLDICNDKRYNGDGLDFDGCQDVYVSGCKILGTDDNLCLQASSKEKPVKNVHITNCSFTSICAGIRIGLKSIGDISSVVISNCTFDRVWREGIKIECTEGGNISDITVTGIVMRNVTRPFFFLLNNRFEDIGSSVGLIEMPAIGTMGNILVSNVVITDDEEMKNTHYRFKDDIMGRPSFNGIRIDAHENNPITTILLRDIVYSFIGGVKLSEIPSIYPKVLDKRIHKEEVSSENYYPDWSRAAFLDVRNVKNLSLRGICLNAINPDERPPYILEECSIIAQEIDLLL